MEMIKVRPGDSSKRWCFQWMMQRYSDNLKTLSNQRSLSPSVPMHILRIWYNNIPSQGSIMDRPCWTDVPGAGTYTCICDGFHWDAKLW